MTQCPHMDLALYKNNWILKIVENSMELWIMVLEINSNQLASYLSAYIKVMLLIA